MEEEEESSEEEEEEESQLMDIEDDGEKPIQSHVLGSEQGVSDKRKATSPSGEVNHDSERQRRLQFFQKHN